MRLFLALFTAATVAGCGKDSPSGTAAPGDVVEVNKTTGGAVSTAAAEEKSAALTDAQIENYMRAADEFIRGNRQIAGLFAGSIPSTAMPQPTQGLESFNTMAGRYGYTDFLAFTAMHARVWNGYSALMSFDTLVAAEAEKPGKIRQLEIVLADTPEEDKADVRAAIDELKSSIRPAPMISDELQSIRRNAPRLKQWADGVRARFTPNE
jgi:hypothetical protein